jgi:peptidoglycan/xylan/chitin deacetylase (PgdA/CDA1 family)
MARASQRAYDCTLGLAVMHGERHRQMAGMSRRALLALAGQAVLVSAAAPIVRAAAPLFHGPRDARVIALTIDDDWSAARVGTIFDTLQRASVAATFFPYAEATRSDPGLWRAITAAGYPYANHTRSHPWMTKLTPHLAIPAGAREAQRLSAVLHKEEGDLFRRLLLGLQLRNREPCTGSRRLGDDGHVLSSGRCGDGRSPSSW